MLPIILYQHLLYHLLLLASFQTQYMTALLLHLLSMEQVLTHQNTLFKLLRMVRVKKCQSSHVIPFPTVPSTSPLLVRHKVLSSTKLVVQWSPPNSQDQNGEIHHYSLELNDTIGVRTVIGTSHTVFNLHPYYIYNYRVAAFTVALGPYSQWRSVRMPPACKIILCT